MGKIKVAIIGVGNCASSLVQGVHKYVEIPDDAEVTGVMHNNIGGYRIEDIDVVAAFDIDENKVGKDLSEAIFTTPNNGNLDFHPGAGFRTDRRNDQGPSSRGPRSRDNRRAVPI